MAQTLTYNLTEQLLSLAGGVRVFTRHFSAHWPTNQGPEEGSTAADTIHANQFTIHEHHPLISLFGKYADEPLWDGFEEAIRRLREEENATLE